jgi:uncharacterized membrane protein YccF (DUF307 family)
MTGSEGRDSPPPQKIEEAGAVEPTMESRGWEDVPTTDRNGCLRIAYYLFIGWWAAFAMELVGLFCLYTLILMPIGAYILERVPCAMTLRNYRWRWANNQAHLAIRYVYFFLFGWLIGSFVSLFAHVLNLTIIGLPWGQDLMERRSRYYSLTSYVPKNMPVEEEPGPTKTVQRSFIEGAVFLLIVFFALCTVHITKGINPGDIPKAIWTDGANYIEKNRRRMEGDGSMGILRWLRIASEKEARSPEEMTQEMFNTALGYHKSGADTEAISLLENLLQRYPDQPLAKQARGLLEELQNQRE